MKSSGRYLLSAAVLVSGIVAALPSITAWAQDSEPVGASRDIDLSSGQINLGFDPKVPTTQTPRRIPTYDEARAAIMMPDEVQPALGANSTSGNGQQSSSATGTTSTVGSAGQQQTAPSQPPMPTSGGPSAGQAVAPIGAIGQTMPSTLSRRNDILDRVPVMAMPMKLSDQDRQRVYQTIMAEKSQPVADAEKLVPGDYLSTRQALSDTHPLPDDLQQIKLLKGLNYLKTKDRVLLVPPETRAVVDEIKQ